MDPIKRHAQLFGGNLRHGGEGTLANFLPADRNFDGAVFIQA